jgi:aminoglycoside phosphotransferase (APT) family kinase protein
MDTAIWRVEAGGQTFALRLFRPEQANSCRREIAAMRAAAEAGIAVPRVHAEGVWRDRPAMLLGWVPGRTLTAEIQARPWRLWPLAVAFGRMQARVHAVAAPPLLGPTPDAWLRWLGPEQPALADRLRALAPDAAALLHFDYHPLNVMTDGREITGVIDWTNTAAGDPRADFARTLVILRVAVDMDTSSSSAGQAMVKRLAIGMLIRGWRRGYAEVAGPPGDLAPFHAWAGVAIERDLTPRSGRHGLPPRALAGLRRWTAEQKRRAGVAAGK